MVIEVFITNVLWNIIVCNQVYYVVVVNLDNLETHTSNKVKFTDSEVASYNFIFDYFWNATENWFSWNSISKVIISNSSLLYAPTVAVAEKAHHDPQDPSRMGSYFYYSLFYFYNYYSFKPAEYYNY